MEAFVEIAPVHINESNSARRVQSRHFSASDFTAKNIACVVANERSFLHVTRDLEGLGFEVACSSSLEDTFQVVAEDPEAWAMIIVRLDQPLNGEHLDSYIRLLRMLDVPVPVMIILTKQQPLMGRAHPAWHADCVVEEPKSQEQLSIALQVAANAKRFWGRSFGDFGRVTLNRLCRARHTNQMYHKSNLAF